MDPDKELRDNPAYSRILAELSPDERLRTLGLDFNLQAQLAKKRAYRRALATLSPAKKLRLLEELRRRVQLQRGTRRSSTPNVPSGDFRKAGRVNLSAKKRKAASGRTQNRFGGRATAGGVSYEVRVAAFIAVKMLCGDKCSAWDGINRAALSEITLHVP